MCWKQKCKSGFKSLLMSNSFLFSNRTIMEDNKSISEDADQPSEESTVTTAASSATIFVGNLPFDTRDDQLEKVFSEIGPIKRAFIVKDKDNRSKSRGCGYVQFVLQEDADKCVKATKTIGNRQLRLNYAAKKPKHAKRKLLALQKANENADQSTGETVEKENSLPEPKKVKVCRSNCKPYQLFSTQLLLFN